MQTVQIVRAVTRRLATRLAVCTIRQRARLLFLVLLLLLMHMLLLLMLQDQVGYFDVSSAPFTASNTVGVGYLARLSGLVFEWSFRMRSDRDWSLIVCLLVVDERRGAVHVKGRH